ncbi:MAG: hypothetical protein Fues2KO_00290 [Fuerstiella sp.]
MSLLRQAVGWCLGGSGNLRLAAWSGRETAPQPELHNLSSTTCELHNLRAEPANDDGLERVYN